MPLIACLGWGSLVWDPRELPIHRNWFSDGPLVKVDLLRQSADGRMTFVLCASAQAIRACWALMDDEDLDSAKRALQRREGNIRIEHVGVWKDGDPLPGNVLGLDLWSKSRGLNAVIWTALPPRFAGEDGRLASVEEVVLYLSGLKGAARQNAERYIRMAPRQVDTRYRRHIEASLGWSPIEDARHAAAD